MSSVKSIAIAGATGYVGYPLAQALLSHASDFKLHVLVREPSVESPKVQELKSKGAIVHGVSYDNEAQLVAALEGVDVVISTVTFTQTSLMGSQLGLMKAAKAAGAKLFFPSEFALELRSDTESDVSKAKKHIAATAKGLGLPITRVFTGSFPDWYIINPIFGFDLEAKEVTIYGTGDEKVTWTAMEDVARFVTYILANVPLAELENQDVRIQGDERTFNQLIAIWEENHKEKLKVEYKPLAELDDRVARNSGDLVAAITRELFSGKAHLKNLSNGLYPNWSPKGVRDIV